MEDQATSTLHQRCYHSTAMWDSLTVQNLCVRPSMVR